jgi:hypothetical protein
MDLLDIATKQKRGTFSAIGSPQFNLFTTKPKWHVQRIRVEPAELGFRFQTTKDPVKLQWEWTPRLEGTKYLAGPWKSLQPGSDSRGYMSVQLSSNGKYMLGHDYGAVGKHGNSDFGILLFGRTDNDLQAAWNAVSKGFRPIKPLSETIDFPEPSSTSAESSGSVARGNRLVVIRFRSLSHSRCVPSDYYDSDWPHGPEVGIGSTSPFRDRCAFNRADGIGMV